MPVVAALFLSLLGQSSLPMADANAAAVTFVDIKPIVDQRCHATKSRFPGFVEAPKGVMFHMPAQIRKLAP